MKAFVSIVKEQNTESSDSIVQYWINNFDRDPACDIISLLFIIHYPIN